MEPLAFYIRQKVHMKSSISCVERRLGAPCFLYVALCMLKVVEAIWSIDHEPLIFCTR
jgi:hypothetical protein